MDINAPVTVALKTQEANLCPGKESKVAHPFFMNINLLSTKSSLAIAFIDQFIFTLNLSCM